MARRLRANENDIFNGIIFCYRLVVIFNLEPSEAAGEHGAQEVRNERALFVYNRVQNKLTGSFLSKLLSYALLTSLFAGRDFDPDVVLSVEDQVDKLIRQAMALENLCQCFQGWSVSTFSPPSLDFSDRSLIH